VGRVWDKEGRGTTRHKENPVREEDLVTYCGGYCGTCARWCGYAKFRDLVVLLAEWVDAQGFQYWLPREMREFDYEEFRKGLDFLRQERYPARLPQGLQGRGWKSGM